MKTLLKHALDRLGLRLSREPHGLVMGHDLWRDLGLLLPADAPVCIDVGANHGDVTARLLDLRPSARIHAFEPVPACVDRLRARFAGNPQVTLCPEGVAEREDRREFHVYANDHLGSFLPLGGDAANPFRAEPEVRRETIPVTTLDAHAGRHALRRIHLLKIDTQGYDLRVLQGATGLLDAGAIDLVLIELNFAALYLDQAAPESVLGLLRSKGLHLVDFYEKCRRDQHLAWCTALFHRPSSS
jgi:FkbM family methyltransferase